MRYGDDGHTALNTQVIAKSDKDDLNLVLVKRSLEEGKEDLVIHGSSNVFGNPISGLTILAGSDFHASSGVCPYFKPNKCLYRTFPSTASIDLQEMATGIAEAVPKLKEVERALRNCGWSIFKEYQHPIEEGHRAVEKKAVKTVEDDNFKYVMTHIKDQYGNARFVIHYIYKEGPEMPSKVLAVMKWLEFKFFNDCPESSYKQCFYNTFKDGAHEFLNHSASDFSKAYQLIIDADSNLRKVGLPILSIQSDRPIVVTRYPVSTEPQVTRPRTSENKATSAKPFEWDVFISHATEDKDTFVRGLVKELTSRDIHVWYDEFTLKVGDSLRQSIDKGLANSRYGIVVLSPNFFAKKWPQDELNGLAAREYKGQKVILPVWLNVDRDYILQFSPILADRVAAKATDGMPKVIADLLAVIKPSR